MIRRKKTTIFTDAKDNTTVQELKKMIEGELGEGGGRQIWSTDLFKSGDHVNMGLPSHGPVVLNPNNQY